MADQPKTETEQKTPEPPPNPSGAPSLLPGDEIIVSKSLDVPEKLWNSAIVTQVFPDQGSCNVVVFMDGGIRSRTAVHYRDDPRLPTNLQWLPPDEPDSGVWQLSRKERMIRDNQKTLARVQELLVQLTDKVDATEKATAKLADKVDAIQSQKGRTAA